MHYVTSLRLLIGVSTLLSGAWNLWEDLALSVDEVVAFAFKKDQANKFQDMIMTHTLPMF